jgi:nucleoside-diphosphate-sugar epimerase
MKRVLLLGGTGYIGSRILDVLRGVGDVRIMVLAHRNVPYRSLEDVDLVVDSLTTFDLSWIERFEPDTIIHAARLGASGRWRRRLASWRGRRANQRLADWLEQRARDTRVLYVSGTLVYGDRGEVDTDEQAPLSPTGFARDYIRAEEPWLHAQRTGALRITIVRPPWVVGPGSWLHGHYVRPARHEGRVPVYGTGGNWMTLLDVDDCAEAIVRLAARPQLPETVNLFTPGQTVRQKDFAMGLAELLGVHVRPVLHDDPRFPRDRALGESLTFSMRSATLNPDLLRGHAWKAPTWMDMLSRHLVLP